MTATKPDLDQLLFCDEPMFSRTSNAMPSSFEETNQRSTPMDLIIMGLAALAVTGVVTVVLGWQIAAVLFAGLIYKAVEMRSQAQHSA